MNSNFLKRAITGVIFAAVLVGCILGGPIPFTLLFATITALTIFEFGTIINKSGEAQVNRQMTVLAGVFMFLCFGYTSIMPGTYEIFIPYLFLLMYLLISELYKKQKNPKIGRAHV